MQDISKYFRKAGLNIVISDRPIRNLGVIGPNLNKIFQMTIDSGKHEQFRIFKGIGSDVRVLDVAPQKEQVLLYVKEPKRIFKEVRYDRKQHKDVETIHETPDRIRRYLMGMDETHYFISELPDNKGKINTVEDAHHILKPKETQIPKNRFKVKIQRQGEWFFIPASSEEVSLINGNKNLIMCKHPLPRIIRNSKPHIAEMVVTIGDNTFIKGKVRHSDHKTKEFFVWNRVYLNTEKRDRDQFTINGWID